MISKRAIRDGVRGLHEAEDNGSVDVADAKHSTSASPESEVAKNAPRANYSISCQIPFILKKLSGSPSQKVVASPRHPNSIRVEIGFCCFLILQARLNNEIPGQRMSSSAKEIAHSVKIMRRPTTQTNIAKGTNRAESGVTHK